MVAANLVQRGLKSLGEQFRPVRTGEGDKDAQRAGGTQKKGKARKAKDAGGAKGLGGALGLARAGYVDAWEDDDEGQRRRRKSRLVLGDDEAPVFIAKTGEHRDLSATVAPEFRAQVAAGLVRANTLTAGSTLVDPGAGAGGEGW